MKLGCAKRFSCDILFVQSSRRSRSTALHAAQRSTSYVAGATRVGAAPCTWNACSWLFKGVPFRSSSRWRKLCCRQEATGGRDTYQRSRTPSHVQSNVVCCAYSLPLTGRRVLRVLYSLCCKLCCAVDHKHEASASHKARGCAAGSSCNVQGGARSARRPLRLCQSRAAAAGRPRTR